MITKYFMTSKWFRVLLLVWTCLAWAACSNGTADKAAGSQDSVITDAQLLEMEVQPTYTKVVVKDPWKKGQVLHTYILVPSDEDLPGNLPQGTVVRTPLKNALVYSSVHTAVMEELSCGSSVKGVCDANFFTDSLVLAGLKNGSVTDCGSSMAPSVEKVINMSPDGILLSPFQDGTYGQIAKLNIPIIECADYMEGTPLGRAEWIKFYGALLGKLDVADSIFNEVKTNYNRIKAQVAKSGGKRPLVLTETVVSGVWNVPGGQSYMARLIEDAGGDWPWADDKSTGSLTLDFNQVLAKAQHADVWLIKAFGVSSYADLKAGYGLNDQFDAFKNRHVWFCDTQNCHIFEEFPFHPERLLNEYYTIFHPNVKTHWQMRYYKPLADK